MSNKIHIVHTNDLHSHMEEMEKVYSFVQRKRKEYESKGESMILVDLGDHMDRFRMETEGTMGKANRAILEATGYEIITLGNNELLTFSNIDLAEAYHQAPFQVISSNVRIKDGKKLPIWLDPWQIKKVNGTRIGFIGVTVSYPIVYDLLGWQVEDPMEAIRRDVQILKEQVDVLVLLSHLGLYMDRKIAQEIPGIDVIIGAHTHHLLEEPERINQTMIVAAGKFGEYIGEIDIHTDFHHQPVSFEAQVHLLELEESANEIKEILHQQRHLSLRVLSEKVVELEEALPISWHKESPFSNLLADELCRWTGAEIGLVNSGVLLGSLPSGIVTKGKVHTVCPHPINPVVMEISGSDLREALGQSLLTIYQNQNIRGYGFRGKILGSLAVSGLQIVTVPTAGGSQIHDIYVGDHQLEDEKIYQLATIDMFTFGSGYVSLKEGTVQKYFLPEFLRDLLVRALQNPHAIEQAYRKRWHETLIFDSVQE